MEKADSQNSIICNPENNGTPENGGAQENSGTPGNGGAQGNGGMPENGAALEKTASTWGRPLVGVIDYDAWLGDVQAATDIYSLTPEKWMHRLPYYAEVYNDTGRIAKNSEAPGGFVYHFDAPITGIMIFAAYDPDGAIDAENDIQIFFSPDNVNYTRYAAQTGTAGDDAKKYWYRPQHMPQVTIIKGTETGWTKVNYWAYNFACKESALSKGAEYVKIVLGKAALFNPQIMRVEISYMGEGSQTARFVDDLNNFDMMYSHDGNLVIKSDSPEDFRLVAGFSDTQQTVDEQIAYAKSANIDYFAILDFSMANLARQKIELIRASRYKNDIKYCVMMHLTHDKEVSEPWEDRINRYIGYFRDDNYVKVCGGRPLVYAFLANEWTAAEIGQLREAAKNGGLPDPYIAVISPIATSTYYDAGSHYGGLRAIYIEPAGPDNQTIPAISLGVDDSPRWINPFPGGECGWWNEPALTPAELTAFVKTGLKWYDNHRSAAEAQTFLIYAWNEYAECCNNICPTIGADGKPDTANLDAVGEAIRSFTYTGDWSYYS